MKRVGVFAGSSSAIPADGSWSRTANTVHSWLSSSAATSDRAPSLTTSGNGKPRGQVGTLIFSGIPKQDRQIVQDVGVSWIRQ